MERSFALIGPRSYQSLADGFDIVPTLRQVVEKMRKIYCGKVGVCTQPRMHHGVRRISPQATLPLNSRDPLLCIVCQGLSSSCFFSFALRNAA
jgi:hypothetical protein